MQHTGNLKKMKTEQGDTVQYYLPVGDELLSLNQRLGQTIRLKYEGEINCVACGRKTSKSFSQGHCYPCLQRLASCDQCIIRPELCHFHEGTCREPEWGERHCFQDHIVYLANTSGPKVGITRGSQAPTRWIDQGAVAAIPLYRVSNRRLAGLLEVAFKEHVSDRTQWQRMLKGSPPGIDMEKLRSELWDQAAEVIGKIVERYGQEKVVKESDQSPIEITYPVITYPEKVRALNFDKNPEVSGMLQGIKGQYLILDTGVLNIRKFGGYRITVY